MLGATEGKMIRFMLVLKTGSNRGNTHREIIHNAWLNAIVELFIKGLDSTKEQLMNCFRKSEKKGFTEDES